MTELKVIQGHKALTDSRASVMREIKRRASANYLAKHSEGHDKASEDEKIILAWHMMKLVVLSKGTGDIGELCLMADSAVNQLLQGVSVAKFETYFPIEKEYDGDRWDTIDYFYTKAHISTIKRIGDVAGFLLGYNNLLVRLFNVMTTMEIANWSKEQHGYDPFETLLQDIGEPLYKVSKQHGKTILRNQITGEQQIVGKPCVRHLRVVK